MIAHTAELMQRVFGPIVAPVTTAHQVIRRQRKFTPTTLLPMFVLGFLRKPGASSHDLAITARQLGVDVTPQAIDDRVRPSLRDALKALWERVIDPVVAAPPRALPLLQKFTAVLVGDSTTITVAPALAEEYPGCGGRSGSGKAAVKIQVLWDLVRGALTRAAIEPGRQNDGTSPAVDPLPPAGSLMRYDLGYFALDRFRRWTDAGVFWISRGLAHRTVAGDGPGGGGDLLGWVARHPGPGPIDAPAELGSGTPVGCRVIALAAPPEVVARRRQKAYAKAGKKGRVPSAQQLAWCGWTVFLTNVPVETLTWKEVVVLYRARWQVELRFKLWKSHNQLAAHRSDDPVRQMVELYARLIGVVVQHWLVRTAGWPDTRLSPVKAARVIREHLPRVIHALGSLAELGRVLELVAALVARRARINSRAKNPSTEQLLRNPELLTYTP